MTAVIVGTLNVSSAILGMVAAFFWFSSARIKNPDKLATQEDESLLIVPLKPLLKAMSISAEFNKAAALFSGMSALFMGVATLLAASLGK
jgi:hypothetical protein